MTEQGGVSNRPEMVEAARKFMLTPKVAATSFQEQKLFLVSKGVTEPEIAEARASIPTEQLQRAMDPVTATVEHSVQSPQNKLLAFTQTALVISSLSYAGYRFVRSFVLPKFFDIPDPATEEVRQLQAQVNELQNSIKFVIDSVSQTTQTLSTQQQEISAALLSIANRDAEIGRVETGIQTIKSLLLSHKNFAPIVAPTVTALPNWQRAAVSSVPSNGMFSKEPANFSKQEKDEDKDEFVDSVGDATSLEELVDA